MEESKKHCCCCDDAPEVDTASDTAVPCCCRHKVRSPEEHKALLNRLNRIEGQVRGIRGMLEKDAYCVDILVQVAAANAALNSFSRELLAQHIGSCVADDLRAGSDEKLEELQRFNGGPIVVLRQARGSELTAIQRSQSSSRSAMSSRSVSGNCSSCL